MIDLLKQKVFPKVDEPLKLAYTRQRKINDVVNGIVKSVSAFESYAFNSEFKNQDINVLALGNLISLGAVDKLSFGQLSPDSLSLADKIDKTVENIAQNVQSQKVGGNTSHT